jgi:predicted  nucleic acid-binding Zn-ribbon protein
MEIGMDTKDDITLNVLIDIREEIRETNRRVDKLTGRVDNLEVHVDAGFEKLGQRITHSEIRVATAITELAGSVNDVKTMLGNQLDLRDRVARCENDIAELKRQR